MFFTLLTSLYIPFPPYPITYIFPFCISTPSSSSTLPCKLLIFPSSNHHINYLYFLLCSFHHIHSPLSPATQMSQSARSCATLRTGRWYTWTGGMLMLQRTKTSSPQRRAETHFPLVWSTITSPLELMLTLPLNSMRQEVRWRCWQSFLVSIILSITSHDQVKGFIHLLNILL